MVRISKQDRRRKISKRKNKYPWLNEKSGSMNSFPTQGYKPSINSITWKEGETAVFISKSALSK